MNADYTPGGRQPQTKPTCLDCESDHGDGSAYPTGCVHVRVTLMYYAVLSGTPPASLRYVMYFRLRRYCTASKPNELDFCYGHPLLLYVGPKLRVRPRMERPPASRMLALENFRITTPWSAIFEPGRSALQSIAISVSVCLSACLSVSLYQKPHVQISWNFLRLLPWLSPPMNRLHCCFRVTVESSGTITRSKLVTARQPKRRRLLVRVHCLRDSLAMWTMGRHSTDAERFTTPVQ